jgi:hypothetical protein
MIKKSEKSKLEDAPVVHPCIFQEGKMLTFPQTMARPHRPPSARATCTGPGKRNCATFSLLSFLWFRSEDFPIATRPMRATPAAVPCESCAHTAVEPPRRPKSWFISLPQAPFTSRSPQQQNCRHGFLADSSRTLLQATLSNPARALVAAGGDRLRLEAAAFLLCCVS